MTAVRVADVRAPEPGAAYVVDASLVDVVHAYLTRSGLDIQAVRVKPDQLPRFNVLPTSIRISHLEQARRARLSDREFEVLTLIAEGLSNPEIAEHLDIAFDTAKTFVRHLFRKLGVRDRAHAVAVAYQRGILGGAS